MKPNLKQLSVISLALVLLVGFTFATVARPRAELESLATSEAVPGLVQEAAVEALAEVYVKSDLSLKKLESIAKGDRAGLRKAAVPALVEKYGDVSNINTREKAQEKAKEVRKKAVSGETDAIKEAAGKALATFFTSFNLNGVKGYSTEDLEALRFVVTDKVEFSGLQIAVTEALASIYPNEKSAEELKSMIKEAEYSMIEEAAYEALSVLYSSPLSPSMKFKELQKMAKDKELTPGERKAAGLAFGKLAAENLKLEKLTTLAKNGSTKAVRQGAGEGLAETLISSDKTEEDLMDMAALATKSSSEGYKLAVVRALANRLAN